MTDFDAIGVASLQTLREDVRLSRKALDTRASLALIDLVLRAKEAVRLARVEAARASAPSLFGDPPPRPAPVRLPGDAHG
jgi:hypothetical protein